MSTLTSPFVQTTTVAACIAADFFLAGNAFTQSFMNLPGLIIDFPPPTSPEYAVRARVVGKAWPLNWVVGNNIMRPTSTVTTIGYAISAWSFAQSAERGQDWRVFAFNALLHVSVIVHSAINLQPLNDKLAALNGKGTDGKGTGIVLPQDQGRAKEIATSWIRCNYYRLAIPMVSGVLALSQMLY